MAEGVMTVTDGNFQTEVLDADRPTVVDIWAPRCAPCLRVAPILEELAVEYAGSVRFARLDVDESPNVAVKYAIMSIPTMMLFKDGEVLDKLIGARSNAAYHRWIDSRL